MDPMTIMALASAAMSTAQGGLSIVGQVMGNQKAKRAARLKVQNLMGSLPVIGQETAFQQSRIIDQVDQVTGAQVNSFAGGNIDFTSGSPAILQAMSQAQGETDIAIAGARGAQKRADVFQQIADTWVGQSERDNQLAFGVGTTLLTTIQKWISAGQQAAGGMPGSSGNSISPVSASNAFASARQINGYNGYGV